MKSITNFLFGIGIIFLIVSIFNPFPNIHFGNLGLIVLIIGAILLFTRFIKEGNYKALLSIVITVSIICLIWKLPIIRTSFYKADCWEGAGECVFESSPTGVKYITIKDWGFRKLGDIVSGGNCGIAGCINERHDFAPEPQVEF